MEDITVRFARGEAFISCAKNHDLRLFQLAPELRMNHILEISPSELTHHSKIAQGGFGQIFKVWAEKTDSTLISKQLPNTSKQFYPLVR